MLCKIETFFSCSLSFQDLHIGSSGTMLKNDTKQDYHLTMGYENSTHTVIRFKRKMNTCDGNEDFPITVRYTFSQ
jgi:hypothetical protein